MYLDKDLIEDKIYQLNDQLIDQFNKRKVHHIYYLFFIYYLFYYLFDIYSILPNTIQLFYYGNGKTYKMLFVSNFN